MSNPHNPEMNPLPTDQAEGFYSPSLEELEIDYDDDDLEKALSTMSDNIIKELLANPQGGLDYVLRSPLRDVIASLLHYYLRKETPIVTETFENLMATKNPEDPKAAYELSFALKVELERHQLALEAVIPILQDEIGRRRDFE